MNPPPASSQLPPSPHRRRRAIVLATASAVCALLALAALLRPHHVARASDAAPRVITPETALAETPEPWTPGAPAADPADGAPPQPAVDALAELEELMPDAFGIGFRTVEEVAAPADTVEDAQAKVDLYAALLGYFDKKLQNWLEKAAEDPSPLNLAVVEFFQEKKAKWEQKLANAQQELADLLAAQAAEGGSPPDVAVVVQEAVRPGTAGQTEPGAVATFGLPFPQNAGVIDINGRPTLAVEGAEVFQTKTLATWPDGTVKWALIDVAADVVAGETTGGMNVVLGEGKSGQSNVAVQSAEAITVDTGALTAIIRKGADFNLFDSVVVNGKTLVAPGSGPGIYGQKVDGTPLVPGSDTQVLLLENGPAKAVVRAKGSLMTGGGEAVLAYTCTITARRGSNDLQVDFTVRNSTLAQAAHTQIRGLDLVLVADGVGSGRSATYAGAPQIGEQTVPLGANDESWMYQAQSDAPVRGLEHYGYKPHIPKVSWSEEILTERGYRVVLNGQDVVPETDPSAYPEHGYARLRGDDGGVIVAMRHYPYLYPAAFEVWGNGTVAAGVFTHRNAADYTFVWRQHESRTAVFSFFTGSGPGPITVARRLDAPVTGRAADYAHYDASGAFPYRLVTVAEQNAAYAAMGIPWTVSLSNEWFEMTRFLKASEPGGTNNHANIERRLGVWLRLGYGGQYQWALSDALYKSEWQILRSDGFDHANDPGASNDAAPGQEWYSTAFDGDMEHRYRDGIILAYHLTGDERYREAILDEAEILRNDLYLAPNTRANVQTIRAQALVYEFTQDPQLLAELVERIEFITQPVLEKPGQTSWGWEDGPGIGNRGYFAFDNMTPEKYAFSPVPTYASKGFFEASLAPLAYYHGWRVLGPTSTLGAHARLRMLDLAHYTRDELHPTNNNPENKLAYVYDILGEKVLQWEGFWNHPILLPMAEAYLTTGKGSYLGKGVQQIQGFYDGGTSNMKVLDSRLDVQHFLRVYLDSLD